MLTPMSWELPYPSRRQPVLAEHVVATSQPLAAQAGLEMMRRGGNAVDAALAAAIALTVVEPTSNGVGGDAFAIVADSDGVHGLNASGRAPAHVDVERLLGMETMPLHGWDPVTVPGAVSAWAALSERFGALSLEEVAAPAIRYAREGFLVSPVTAAAWSAAADLHGGREEFATAFLPGGRAPAPGERFGLPDLARTLELIARSSGAAFYTGALAERIVGHAAAGHAPLSGADLARHRPEWVETISVTYGDRTVHELPPNGQGLAVLLALGLLAQSGSSDRDPSRHPDAADGVHRHVEAMKLAFADAHRYIADPVAMDLEVATLLDPRYLAERASQIRPNVAGDPGHGLPRPGGTVYLAAGDADGRLVSYIQSNYHGFGSGIVVPGTGIALHNRGAGFSTDSAHPNAVAGGKRPFHTIIPGLTERSGRPEMAFGVMGGPMQPQGHLQLLSRIIDAGQNPQAASDAPRWRVEAGRDLVLEEGFSTSVAAELTRRGHRVVPGSGSWGFGGAQAVCRSGGGWLGASDHRKDGQAVGF
jgi:gamma-glutamyltranspeptidase / glutathione hydrolase